MNYQTILKSSRRLAQTIIVGLWWQSKFERNAIVSGTQAAARNARKQGVPLDLCLLMLARKG